MHNSITRLFTSSKLFLVFCPRETEWCSCSTLAGFRKAQAYLLVLIAAGDTALKTGTSRFTMAGPKSLGFGTTRGQVTPIRKTISNRQRIKGSPGCSTWKCHDGEEMGFLGYVSKWSRTQELRSFAGSQPNRTFCLEQFEVNIRTSAASVCLKSGWLKKRREWRGRSRGQGKENWIFPYEKSLKRKDWIREGRHDSIPNLCRNLKIIAFRPSSNCTTQLVDRGYGILWADVCRYLMCIICVVPSWCIVPHLGWSHGASYSLEVVVARPPVQLSEASIVARFCPWTERKALVLYLSWEHEAPG